MAPQLLGVLRTAMGAAGVLCSHSASGSPHTSLSLLIANVTLLRITVAHWFVTVTVPSHSPCILLVGNLYRLRITKETNVHYSSP